MRQRDVGQHGVLSSRASMPMYAALLPAAIALRAAWPAVSPSMEVLAIKGSDG